MTIQSRIASVTRKQPVSVEVVLDESRRWAQRKPTTNGGQILFDGITTPYVCTVRDISSTGVKLEMTRNKYNPDGASAFIPTYFSLIIPFDRTRVECQSVWRRGSLVGARFLAAVEHMPLPSKRAPLIQRKKK